MKKSLFVLAMAGLILWFPLLADAMEGKVTNTYTLDNTICVEYNNITYFCADSFNVSIQGDKVINSTFGFHSQVVL